MKTRYQVLLRETYRKWVTVVAENEDELEDEVRAMEENGEIDWDSGEDFDCWEILEHKTDPYLPEEVKSVKKWCSDMVSAVQIIDPDWVLLELSEEECEGWLDLMRDRGMTIPKEVTSEDLWDAVKERRENEKI